MNESLPNITGECGYFYRDHNMNDSGALYRIDGGEDAYGNVGSIAGNSWYGGVGLNASYSSSVYQNNAKVRPDTCKTNIVIKY